MRKARKKEAEMTIIEAKQNLEKADVPYAVSLVLNSNPAKALGAIAKQENFGLIVIGNRGLGSKLSCFWEVFQSKLLSMHTATSLS